MASLLHKAGDLLWVRVAGHGFWPAQVMDISLATPQARKMQKPGHILLSFFGDQSFGWWSEKEYTRDFLGFEAGYEEKRQQKPKSAKGKVRRAAPRQAPSTHPARTQPCTAQAAASLPPALQLRSRPPR